MEQSAFSPQPSAQLLGVTYSSVIAEGSSPVLSELEGLMELIRKPSLSGEPSTVTFARGQVRGLLIPSHVFY